MRRANGTVKHIGREVAFDAHFRRDRSIFQDARQDHYFERHLMTAFGRGLVRVLYYYDDVVEVSMRLHSAPCRVALEERCR